MTSRAFTLAAKQAKEWIQANEAARTSLREYTSSAYESAVQRLAFVETDRLARMSLAAGPFSASLAASQMHSARARLAVDSYLARPEWTRSIGIPVIDEPAANAIGKLWGAEGLLRQVHSLDLDRAIEKLLQGTELEAPEADSDDDHRAEAGPLEIAGISLWNWLSILSVLLGVVVPIWQKSDSDATEGRIVAEVKDADERNAARVQALTNLLERMIDQSRVPSASRVFVARDRVALVRRFGKPGGTVVAEVFPNQVVELVSENGKWIEVRYFDWVAQQEKTGWVQKKYFMRVLGTPTQVGPGAGRAD